MQTICLANQRFRNARAKLRKIFSFGREAPVQFGSVTVWGWKGSSGSGFRFWRFLCKRGFSVFQYSLTGRDGSGFGSWKTVPAVPVPLSVSGKTVPTVPVSGSGSVPEPPCFGRGVRFFLVSDFQGRKSAGIARSSGAAAQASISTPDYASNWGPASCRVLS